MKLKDKIVLITGGNRGIGLALAHCFYRNGAKVIVTGRSEENLDAVYEDNPEIQTHYLDLLDPSCYQNLFDNVKLRYGKLDILINNAAVLFSGDFTKNAYSYKQISLEINTNVSAPIAFTKTMLPLLEGNSLSIVCNITSAVANLPMKSLPVYSATKSALRSFSISLRESVSKSNIRVVEVQPPLVATNMTSSLPGKARDMKMISPAECAKGIVNGIKRDKELILIGNSTKSLFWGSKFFPKLILKNLNKM